MSRARKKKGEMNGNSHGFASSGGWAATERRGGEPGEPKRSGGAAQGGGGLRPLPRGEGLRSSLLPPWRRERATGILEALTPQQRGPKSKRNPMEEENQKLRRQNARLPEDLRKALLIFEIPKK